MTGYRTAVVDVVAQQMDGVKPAEEVDGILDCSLSATEHTIKSRHKLLDWEEYRRV